MRVQVNGVRLFFEIEGTKLRLTDDSFVEVPTLLLLHGGPGGDHSVYRPAFSALSDIAQIVYLDHRGNGRSDHGPKDLWNLSQWADDVKAFCDALEIKQPIVYGASFGGMVAMAYATRHPSHPLALALVSTTAQARSHIDEKIAMFSRLGRQRTSAVQSAERGRRGSVARAGRPAGGVRTPAHDPQTAGQQTALQRFAN